MATCNVRAVTERQTVKIEALPRHTPPRIQDPADQSPEMSKASLPCCVQWHLGCACMAQRTGISVVFSLRNVNIG
jgi:hypothetical protein